MKYKLNKKEAIKTTFIVLISTIILILLIILAIYLLSLNENQNNSDNNNNPINNKNSNTIYVSRIIDGDTFQLSDNSTIRLICVDAPEKGKTGYKEAGDFLSEMILNKEIGNEIKLEKDTTDKDDYGRLLRYVYVNISGVELFVNQQLVQEGYAKIFRYGNDTKRCDEIEGI